MVTIAQISDLHVGSPFFVPNLMNRVIVELNEGQIGRERYEWIKESFAKDVELKVFALHHHLLPVPGTGRERSTVTDAGDLLELLIELGVQVVLSGHKHVPYVWRLEGMY